MPDSSFYVNKIGPVHASEYFSTDQILLAAGVGPSKTGQRNRLATYSISQSLASSATAAQRSGVCTGEALFADDEDAPSSFAVHEDLVVAGVNESAASRKHTGDNYHLRMLRLMMHSMEKGESTTFRTLTQHQIYEDLSVELDDYQKVTKFREDGRYIALISNEGYPAIVETSNMTRVPIDIFDSKQPNGKAKVLDIEFSKGKLWIADTKTIRTLSLPLADDLSVVLSLAQSSIPKNFVLAQFRIVDQDTVLLGLNDANMKQSFIATYEFRKGQLVQSKIAHMNSKIRSLYINTRHPTPTKSQLIALTTADGRLSLFDPDLNHLKTWKGLHQFPISTVAFRHDGKQLITCSIDEKINVIDLVSLGSETSLFTQFFMLFIALLLAFLMFHYLKRA